jgi:hypothetical protein
MSSLSKQLQQIKLSQPALKVGPNQNKPTLLLDTHTASTTSSDIVYTMAVISYSQILKSHPQLKLEG